MSTTYDAIEQAAKKLPLEEKATLAQTLLKDLDGFENDEIRTAWLEESKRRYEAYQRGEMEAIDGDEVMARLRDRLRK